jgi:hypothetical protein
MAPPNKPVIGNLYDMEQQHTMHGGALEQRLDDRPLLVGQVHARLVRRVDP